MITALLAICLAIGSGFLIGWDIHARLTTNYRKRWQEAVELLKQEKLGTRELAQELEDHWYADFRREGNDTVVYLVRGDTELRSEVIWYDRTQAGADPSFSFAQQLIAATYRAKKTVEALERVDRT